MVEPRQQFHFTIHTWVHHHLLLLLLLLLFVSLMHSHGAEAQSPIQPLPAFAVTHHRSWDPSVAIIVTGLICAFLIVSLFSIYLRNCSDSSVTDLNPVGDGVAVEWPCSCSNGIDPEILDKFPILFYSTIKDLKIGKGALECAVCLNEFKDFETLRLLPICNHVFHPDCIDAWLSSHVTCPVCRANLNQDFGEFAIAIEAQLNAHQVNEESAKSRAEQNNGVNEIKQCPLAPNANEGESNINEYAGKRNRSPKLKLLERLPRSNSTGHSLFEPGKCVEKYTLRLPEDVRKYVLLNHEMMERSASYHVVIQRKGLCWSDSEGSSRGKRVLPRTSPFVVGVEESVIGNSSNTCSPLSGFCSRQRI